MSIPKRVADRLVAALKTMRPIIEQQRARDVSEADTSTLVKDLLCEAFGYDKYTELTSEFAIRGTYCDLAIKLADKLTVLIEVKAIGIPLDDRHVKQAIDYGANQGVEWVILTNAVEWRLYNIIFAQPIDKRLVTEINLLTVDPRTAPGQESLYPYTKEGFQKGAHLELRDKQDATSRYVLAALLLNNESVLSSMRRELRRVVDVLVDEKDIVKVMRDEVIKRDALEGPAAAEALKRISRREERPLRKAKMEESATPTPEPEPIPPQDAGAPGV